MVPQTGVEFTVLDGYRALRESWASCFGGKPPWPGQPGLIELQGKDRLEWLQGQATNDISRLTVQHPIDFCLCQPTGQLLAPCRAWPEGERILIETPLPCVPLVLERAESMVVMEDVQARDLTETYELMSFQGPKAQDGWDEYWYEWASGHEPFDVDWREWAGGRGPILALPSDHCGSGGIDLWIPVEDNDSPQRDAAALPKAPIESLKIARLEAGVPIFGVDMDARTLPPEMGPEFEKRNIDYGKGCYVGQEVLQRIHSRGHTNKTWMGLILKERVLAEDKVFLTDGEMVGSITSAAVSPQFGPIAGAMLKNKAAVEGTELTVKALSGDVGCKVTQMPILKSLRS